MQEKGELPTWGTSVLTPSFLEGGATPPSLESKMLDRPEVDEGGGCVCEAHVSVPLIASAPREPTHLSGLCHIGHMDGVDATGIGPEALDLCTVLEHPLSCNWTKEKQLQVS